MSHQTSQFTHTDNKKTQRYLSRQLIQHIISLYDSIIQKIQHGIGLLWEQYFSKQLFHTAKLRVQHQLINDIPQLNHWFQKISANIRDKVTNLSANLLSHFNDIIKAQADFLNYPVEDQINFKNQHQLSQKSTSEIEDLLSQKKLNHSHYQTCTESSRGYRKKHTQERLQTVSSQSICSQAVSISLQEDHFHLNTNIESNQLILPQMQANRYLKNEHRQKNLIPKRLRKVSQYNDSDHDQEADGSFYEVFLGILDTFEI